jgi:hypothetical protein
MPISLEDIDISAWTALETAASDPQSGFRSLNRRYRRQPAGPDGGFTARGQAGAHS